MSFEIQKKTLQNLSLERESIYRVSTILKQSTFLGALILLLEAALELLQEHLHC